MTSQVREQPRVELRRVRRSARSRVTPVEAAAAIITVIAMVVVAVHYFNALKPERQRVVEAQHRLDQQERTLLEQRSREKTTTDDEGDTSGQAKESLAQFKEKWLKPLGQGRIALIDDINALTGKTGVQLTSGIEMQTGNKEESTTEKRDRQRKTEEVLDVYPKIEIQFTVFGQYHNLRGFVKELESNKQFLVLREITLTSVDETQGGSARGPRHAVASGIALTISATCYFRP